MGGGKSGGKGGDVNVTPSPYEQAMAKIATDYYKATDPTRGYFLEDWEYFLRPPGGTGYGVGSTGTPSGATTTVSYTGGPGASTSDLRQYGLYPDVSGNLVPIGANIGTEGGRLGIKATQTPTFAGFYGGTPIYEIGGSLFSPQGGDYHTLLDYFNRQNQISEAFPAGKTGEGERLIDKVFNPSALNYGASGTYLPFQGDPGAVNWYSGYTGPKTVGGASTTTTTYPGTSGYQSGGLYGGYDPYRIPGYAPLYQLARQGVESQFSQAREGVLGSLPRGGALAEGLTNLEMQRAIQAGSLPAQIAAPLIQDIMNKAYGAAFGAPATSISGLGGAASSYAGRYGSALAAQNQAPALGLGSLAAMGLSGKGGKGAAAAPVEYMMGGGIFGL